MDKSQIAKENFLKGYNCAQAVVLAFADDMNMDSQTALKLASPFGGGLSRLREVCGAVSGMAIVFGMLYGYDSPTDQQKKAYNYAEFQSLANEFKAQNGSIICKELLGEQGKSTAPTPEKRTDEYYKKRPCVEMVGSAAKILEEYIKTHR